MSSPLKIDHAEFLTAASGASHLDGYRTLVLNADYQPFSVLPLSTMTWKEAISGVIQDKYDIVLEYENVYIRSPSISIPLPSVVASRKYRNPDHSIPFSKKNIFLRDEYLCQFCGNEFSGTELTFDHLVPRSKGGKTDWDNIVSSCDKCNRAKGNKTNWISPLGLDRPLNMPFKPTYFDLAAKMKKRKLIIPEGCGWEEFIQWDGPLYMKTKHGTYQMSGEPIEEIGDEQVGM